MANLDLEGDMSAPLFFENLKWMTVREAAVYLRRTQGAMKNLIYRGKVRTRKWAGRVYVNRMELDSSIEAGLL